MRFTFIGVCHLLQVVTGFTYVLAQIVLFSVFSCEPRLYKRVCPSVRWSVGPSVRGDRAFETQRLCLSVFVSKCGVGEGVDEGWMPLPTRPQRYCDPASLVISVILN